MSRGVRDVTHRRWLRRGLLAAAVIVITWLVACLLIVFDPTVNRATHADAVVVLGPPTEDGRLNTGLALINQGYASNLLISVNSPNQRQASALCAQPPAGVSVTCFTPDPATTQGEAQEIRRVAAAQHRSTAIMVTSTYPASNGAGCGMQPANVTAGWAALAASAP